MRGDKEKARKSAVIAGFEEMELLGPFIVAKNLGLLKEIRPSIEELKRKRFRVSDTIEFEALRKAGEHPK